MPRVVGDKEQLSLKKCQSDSDWGIPEKTVPQQNPSDPEAQDLGWQKCAQTGQANLSTVVPPDYARN